jgi:hypothetical protein
VYIEKMILYNEQVRLYREQEKLYGKQERQSNDQERMYEQCTASIEAAGWRAVLAFYNNQQGLGVEKE